MKRHAMPFPRYAVLRAAGPTITAEDVERLKAFYPRPTQVAIEVHAALWQIAREARAKAAP